MLLTMSAVVPYSTEKRRQTQVSTKSQRKNSTAGFGARKSEPLWQCVKNCGACCKLDKGPNFPSPEEIFDDSSDIQALGVRPARPPLGTALVLMDGAYTLRKAQEHAPYTLIGRIFVGLSQMFLKLYIGFIRKGSTRKLAVAA